MTQPVIPVSWGELLDKISILEIKTHRLRVPQARDNAASELRLLRQAAAEVPQHQPLPNTQHLPELAAALRAVNTRLWRIEDQIRAKEAAGDFGSGFIALARSVYHQNDERGRIKQALNQLLQSSLIEEKQYHPYLTTAADVQAEQKPRTRNQAE